MLACPHTPFGLAQDRPFDRAQDRFTRQRVFVEPPHLRCQRAFAPSIVIPYGVFSSRNPQIISKPTGGREFPYRLKALLSPVEGSAVSFV